jgi:hypothetical protein
MTSPFSILTFLVVTILCFLHITCNSSLVQILQPYWSFIGSYVLLSTFCSHVSRDNFICTVTAHVSQPYNTMW